MKAALKIAGLLFFFILVMSITIKDQPLFSYIYNAISPLTTAAQETTEHFFKRSVSSTQSYSKKLFENSAPRVRDGVRARLSATSRDFMAKPAEQITSKEKSKLNDLIKTH